MTNLKLYRDDFRYRNAERGDVVTIEVEHRDGGPTTRGVYVAGRFSTIEESGTGFTSEAFLLYGGRKGFSIKALPLTRKNQRKLEAVANMIDAHAPAIAEALDKGGRELALDMVKGILAGGAA